MTVHPEAAGLDPHRRSGSWLDPDQVDIHPTHGGGGHAEIKTVQGAYGTDAADGGDDIAGKETERTGHGRRKKRVEPHRVRCDNAGANIHRDDE